MLNIHGMYNVWLCVVYEILLCWLAPSVTNLRDIITRKKYLEIMWIQYCNRPFHSCHEKMSSVPTSYIIRYCHECVGY